MPPDAAAFRAKYGPWAVITGASDGTGAAYARQLAALGLNLLLIARRPERLTALAAEIEAAYRVKTRTASIDLYEPGASARVLKASEDLEVGLYVSNAGADPNGARFLSAPLQAWRDLVNRNVVTVLEVTYAFAGAMVGRGRGGLILMSSGTALGGQPGVAVYSATKAFDLTFAESLWTELRPRGINVLGVVAPAMNTPSLQTLLDKRALKVPGLFEPQDVVHTALERLADGPTVIFPFGPDAPDAAAFEKARRTRAESMIEAAKMFFGED
jgi:short-subunit dehydrogenase